MTSEGDGQKVVAVPGPLTSAEAQTLDAYWRAANYLSAGQIYLMANPLLAEPLRAEHIKPRLLGHWGTSPGLNFVWAHLSRVITARRTEMMIVIGPGHGKLRSVTFAGHRPLFLLQARDPSRQPGSRTAPSHSAVSNPASPDRVQGGRSQLRRPSRRNPPALVLIAMTT